MCVTVHNLATRIIEYLELNMVNIILIIQADSGSSCLLKLKVPAVNFISHICVCTALITVNPKTVGILSFLYVICASVSLFAFA